MKTSHKKDYLFIVLVFLLVVGLALLISNRHQRLETIYPDKLTELAATDFILKSDEHTLNVGQSSWEEVWQVYPQGNIMDMISVYRPEGQVNVLTFTKKSNMLTKVNITGPGLITSRGIAVNDGFDKVITAYGKGYIRSYLKNEPAVFDAIYGSKQYIAFHVKNGIVQRIVVEYPLIDSEK